MNTKVTLAAIAAIATLGIAVPVTSNASVTHHAEPAICGPVVALIEYWLPIAGRAVPHRITEPNPNGGVQYAPPEYPWDDAAVSIYDMGRFAPRALSLDAGQVANSIGALGSASPAATWRPLLRQALAGVRGSCPSLPASVVNGPLPR